MDIRTDTAVASPASEAQDALRSLPVAVATLAMDGSIDWGNDRFDSLFDAKLLPSRRLADEARASPVGIDATIAGRSGVDLDMHVQCIESMDLRMLVLSELQVPGAARQLALMGKHLEALEREVLLDPLTQAWNRRYLDRVFPVELTRSRRYRQPLSAALLDIDHFKDVNDNHGHAAGDRVLNEVVRIILSAARTSDIVCRWGGEEFLVLMPCTARADAAIAAERIRAAVAGEAIEGVGRITVSLGVAELRAADDMATFFARVDAMMYDAKQAGRNRVATAPEGASEEWEADAPRIVVQISWHPAYESGNVAIDEEHRELFRLANELIAASVDDDHERAADALARCFEHIERHFEHEEEVLAAAGYAKLAHHRNLHRELLARADTLRTRAQAGEPLTGALVEFLAHEVVAIHIAREDRDFFPLLARLPGLPPGPTQA